MAGEGSIYIDQQADFEESNDSSNHWHQYLAVLLASLSAMTVGLLGGWTSNALPLMALDGDQASWVASLPALGALGGALPAGLIANLLGRRRVLLLLAMPFLLGWLGLHFAGDKIWMAYTARVVSGMAMGAATAVVPLYNEEVSDVKIRGRLGAAQNLLIDVGILGAYLLGALGCSLDVQTLVPCVVPLVQVLTLPFVPESPSYLESKGRKDSARSARLWLRLRTVETRGNVRKQVPGFKRRCRVLFIILGLMVFRQLLGVNAVIYYTVDIFKAAGSSMAPSVATLIVGVVQVLATVVSAVIIEVSGRRVLLITSAVGCALSHLTFSGYAAAEESWRNSLAWLPVLSLNVFIASVSLGFGPITWFVTAEIAPESDKGWISGLAVSVNWTLMFLVNKVFVSCLDVLGQAGTFTILAANSIVASIFVYLIVPESGCKTREAIQTELENSRLLIHGSCCTNGADSADDDATEQRLQKDEENCDNIHAK